MALDARQAAKLGLVSFAGLWLFAAVASLSIAAQNIIFFGMAAWVYLWLRGAKPRPLWPPQIWFFFIFLALGLAASITSENPEHSLATWRKGLLASAMIYAGDALRRDENARESVMGSLLFFSALWALGSSAIYLAKPMAALIQGKTWVWVSQEWLLNADWRARSGSGGYMVLATVSAMLIPFYLDRALASARWRKPLPLLCLGLMALALLLTMTRGAWGACAAACALVLALRKPRWALGFALVLAALYALSAGSVFGQRLRSVGDVNNDSNRERKYMWQAGLVISSQHPWLGVGDAMESFKLKTGGQAQGYYHRLLSDEGRAWYASKGIPPYERGHLHNNVIQIAAMYGIPALFFLAAFLFSLFFRALGEGWREPSSLGLAYASAWLAWSLNGLFEFNMGSVQSSFVFWFLTGLWLASRKEDA